VFQSLEQGFDLVIREEQGIAAGEENLADFRMLFDIGQ
jgi:hypothetical protein